MLEKLKMLLADLKWRRDFRNLERELDGYMAKRPPAIRNGKVTDYWLEFYINNGHCSLCGNHGYIDTTGVRTPAGLEVGRKNFCICPNGQAMRYHTGKGDTDE